MCIEYEVSHSHPESSNTIHRTNTGTTLKVGEGVAHAPAVCLPAGEGVAAMGEAEDVLELVVAVMFVARFAPVLLSVKGMMKLGPVSRQDGECTDIQRKRGTCSWVPGKVG